MINANLEQFLDNGWYMEATLYLNGYTYWLEGCWTFEKPDKFHYFIYKYRSIMIDETHTKRLIVDGDVAEYQELFNEYFDSEEQAKKVFFSLPIFEGKTFWEVEKEIAWYDEE